MCCAFVPQIDMLPVVDLNAGKVVHIDMYDKAPKLPEASVNYHRNKLSSNTYLQTSWRSDALKALDVVQPEGPSFKVEGNNVTWDRWSLRVGCVWPPSPSPPPSIVHTLYSPCQTRRIDCCCSL